MQSMGGKARAAKLTGEERSRIAKVGAVARWGNRPDGYHIPAVGLARTLVAAEQIQIVTEPAGKPLDVTPRPRRSDREIVLAALKMSVIPVDAAMVGARCDFGLSHEDPAHWKRVANTLSSLRTAKKVVSEPMPGSKREKLWRLA